MFTSYNNHPIDSVFQVMAKMSYNGQIIPFPMVRLGSQEKDSQALVYMKELYERTRQVKVFLIPWKRTEGTGFRERSS